MTEATASFAADHYVQRLDLGADPFAAGYKGEFFYRGASRKQLLEQVIHFSRFSDQVVILTGSTGSGTSTLLAALSEQLQEVMACCTINAESFMAPEQILLSLSSQLQFSAANSIAEFLADLRYIAAGDEQPEPILLVIDQAHYMALESYEMLRHLFEAAEGLVHVLLVGEYQIEKLSTLAGYDNRQVKLLELEPLTITEVGEYLLGLLCSVGYAGDQPLSNDQLAVLHEQSGGNIAEINQLAPSLLAVTGDPAAKKYTIAIPSAHIAAIGVLVAALLLSWLYQGDVVPEDSKQLKPASNQPAMEVSRTLLAVPAQLPQVATDSPVSARKVSASNTVQPSVELAKVEVVEETQPAAEAVQPVIATQPAVNVKAEPAKPGLVAKEKPVLRAKPAAVPRELKKPIKVADVKVSVAALTTAVKIPPREQQLLKLPASSYMLQLIGLVDEARMRKFVKRYTGKLPVTYFEARRNGAPWYVVVAGPYKDKAAAQTAKKLLPATLQKQRPWPRSLRGIQKDIRSHRD